MDFKKYKQCQHKNVEVKYLGNAFRGTWELYCHDCGFDAELDRCYICNNRGYYWWHTDSWGDFLDAPIFKDVNGWEYFPLWRTEGSQQEWVCRECWNKYSSTAIEYYTKELRDKVRGQTVSEDVRIKIALSRLLSVAYERIRDYTINTDFVSVGILIDVFKVEYQSVNRADFEIALKRVNEEIAKKEEMIA